MPKVSEMDEKYGFNLVATFSEDVYRSLFMTFSSGKLLSELLSLLLILRKCCQMALVSLDCVTESEKMFAFRFLNQIFCLVTSRFLRVRAISSLY